MTDPVKVDADPADVAVTTTKGSEAIQIDVPHKGKETPGAEEATPEKFSVSQAQFDKFYDPKAGAYNWENHAKELAWQLTQKGDAPAKEQPKATEATAQAAVSKAGLDMEALEQELSLNGKLSPESLDALAKVGIPEEAATGYANYLKGKAEAHVNAVQSYLGGKDGLATLKAWAIENLSVAERTKFEQKLADPGEWRVYADYLKQRAGVRSGNPGKVVHGQNAQGSSNQAESYKSMAEMTADQRNPKYKTDPGFRAKVMERARASTFAANPRAHAV
jgi:hypothetical protein